MLQTSTTDSDIHLFPHVELEKTPVSVLSLEDEAFYSSIKGKLNKLSVEPPQEAVNNIIAYSKSR